MKFKNLKRKLVTRNPKKKLVTRTITMKKCLKNGLRMQALATD